MVCCVIKIMHLHYESCFPKLSQRKQRKVCVLFPDCLLLIERCISTRGTIASKVWWAPCVISALCRFRKTEWAREQLVVFRCAFSFCTWIGPVAPFMNTKWRRKSRKKKNWRKTLHRQSEPNWTFLEFSVDAYSSGESQKHLPVSAVRMTFSGCGFHWPLFPYIVSLTGHWGCAGWPRLRLQLWILSNCKVPLCKHL